MISTYDIHRAAAIHGGRGPAKLYPIPKSTEDPMNRRENGAGRAARRRGLWTTVSSTFLDEIRPSVSFEDSGRQT